MLGPTLDASFGSSRLPFPPPCPGKCYFRAPSECSRWPFPPACRGKGYFKAPRKALGVLSGSTRDGLFLLPVKEKAISGLPRKAYRRRRITRPTPKRTLFLDRHAENILFDSSLCACDGHFPLPVKEKAVSWSWCALVMGFPPCLSRKRRPGGLGVRLRWAFPPACR